MNVWASGSDGAISGAKTAITIQAAAITMPVIASGWRRPGLILRVPATHPPSHGHRRHVSRILGSITP